MALAEGGQSIVLGNIGGEAYVVDFSTLKTRFKLQLAPEGSAITGLFVPPSSSGMGHLVVST